MIRIPEYLERRAGSVEEPADAAGSEAAVSAAAAWPADA
jgi:hypothetical protein